DRAAEDEATRLDAGDLVDLLAGIGMHELIDRAAKRAGVAQKRGDVAKQYPGLWIIRNRADCRKQRFFQRVFHWPRRSIQPFLPCSGTNEKGALRRPNSNAHPVG